MVVAAAGRWQRRGGVAKRGRGVVVAAEVRAVKGAVRERRGAMEWGRCGDEGETSRRRALWPRCESGPKRGCQEAWCRGRKK